MMELFKRLTAVAALAAVSSFASAGTDTGLYLGGSIGQAGIDVDVEDIDFDDDDTAWKAFIGYNLGLLPMVDLAVEGTYYDFGESSGSVLGQGYDAEVDGWGLAAVAGIAVGPVGLFGKVGAISWDSELSTAVGDFDDDGTDPAYGVGAKVQLGSLLVRAEYELFDIDDTEVDFWSVGAAFVF